ncbi:MAG: hypothetical protein Q8O13_00825 [Candidatus Omnitrophota bacterium]|nr:hypothetical protein [Candidatus Omnitrophota bacterium]
MMITTVILGALTNLINIGLTLYNKGKNRNIYEVKTLVSEGSNQDK